MVSRLTYLARGYFHPDYELDSSSELEVVELFKARETAAAAAELRNEIEALLETCTEAELKQKWLDEGDAYYEPDLDGMTYRQWFQRMVEVLRTSS